MISIFSTFKKGLQKTATAIGRGIFSVFSNVNIGMTIPSGNSKTLFWKLISDLLHLLPSRRRSATAISAV